MKHLPNQKRNTIKVPNSSVIRFEIQCLFKLILCCFFKKANKPGPIPNVFNTVALENARFFSFLADVFLTSDLTFDKRINFNFHKLAGVRIELTALGHEPNELPNYSIPRYCTPGEI